MAAAKAVPTAGPGAGVVTDELGLLLDVVTDGSGAVVDVDSGLRDGCRRDRRRDALTRRAAGQGADRRPQHHQALRDLPGTLAPRGARGEFLRSLHGATHWSFFLVGRGACRDLAPLGL